MQHHLTSCRWATATFTAQRHRTPLAQGPHNAIAENVVHAGRDSAACRPQLRRLSIHRGSWWTGRERRKPISGLSGKRKERGRPLGNSRTIVPHRPLPHQLPFPSHHPISTLRTTTTRPSAFLFPSSSLFGPRSFKPPSTARPPVEPQQCSAPRCSAPFPARPPRSLLGPPPRPSSPSTSNRSAAIPDMRSAMCSSPISRSVGREWLPRSRLSCGWLCVIG